MIKYLILILILYGSTISAFGQIIDFNGTEDILNIGPLVGVYEDPTNSLTIDEVLAKDSFKVFNQKFPNLGISCSSFWVEFDISNTSLKESILLQIGNPLLDEIDLYYIDNGNNTLKYHYGDILPYSNRKFKHQKFLFDLKIPFQEQKKYLIRLRSWEQLSLSIQLGKSDNIYEANLLQDLIYGLFFGIIIALVLYNIFIYVTVKDKSYLFYVIYILFIALTQATIQGYPFRFLWPNMPDFSNHSLILFPSIAGIATLEFIKIFLKTKTYSPYLHKGLIIISIIYFSAITSKLMGFNTLSFRLIDFNSILISIYTLTIAITISIKGYRPAKFFLIAWALFLIGVIGFVLRNEGILPSNNFTNYAMSIGTAMEVLLLSFALADRINILRAEKEASQLKTVELLKENEKMIKHQNINLEKKVTERTEELNNTLIDLKQAQTKLVDSEKMSSLGLLTAGIAHEINNPINFVSSNIHPLRQDIDDLHVILAKYEELETSNDIPEKLLEIDALKKELDYDYLKKELYEIIDGIDDGATRTAEIVSGLKNFSRLDEGEFKLADLNQGIKSTLLIIKSKLENINIELDLGDIPKYGCNPGKINQLLLNLIDNAIYAAKKNHEVSNDGLIKIKTSSIENSIILSISDNGIGIPEDHISKLFDPFFTTKDIGEGTGLGLSIVRGIVDSHNAEIKVESSKNVGTEIIISFPLKA